MTLHGEPLTLTTFAANLDGVLISPTGEIDAEHDVLLSCRLRASRAGPGCGDDDSLHETLKSFERTMALLGGSHPAG